MEMIWSLFHKYREKLAFIQIKLQILQKKTLFRGTFHEKQYMKTLFRKDDTSENYLLTVPQVSWDNYPDN